MWRSEPGIQCPAGGGQRLKALPQRTFYFRNLHGSNETLFFLQFEKAQKSFQAHLHPTPTQRKLPTEFC